MTTLQRGSLNLKLHSYEQLVSVHEAVLKWLLCSEHWVMKDEILKIAIDLDQDQHFQNILKMLILVETNLNLENLIFNYSAFGAQWFGVYLASILVSFFIGQKLFVTLILTALGSLVPSIVTSTKGKRFCFYLCLSVFPSVSLPARLLRKLQTDFDIFWRSSRLS